MGDCSTFSHKNVTDCEDIVSHIEFNAVIVALMITFMDDLL